MTCTAAIGCAAHSTTWTGQRSATSVATNRVTTVSRRSDTIGETPAVTEGQHDAAQQIAEIQVMLDQACGDEPLRSIKLASMPEPLTASKLSSPSSPRARSLPTMQSCAWLRRLKGVPPNDQ